LEVPVYQKLKNDASVSKAFFFSGTITWENALDFDTDTFLLESKAFEIADLRPSAYVLPGSRCN